jgi:hypothetical protein
LPPASRPPSTPPASKPRISAIESRAALRQGARRNRISEAVIMAELNGVSKQSLATWERFLSLTKWAIILIAIVLTGMALFLT